MMTMLMYMRTNDNPDIVGNIKYYVHRPATSDLYILLASSRLFALMLRANYKVLPDRVQRIMSKVQQVPLIGFNGDFAGS